MCMTGELQVKIFQSARMELTFTFCLNVADHSFLMDPCINQQKKKASAATEFDGYKTTIPEWCTTPTTSGKFRGAEKC